MFRLQLLSSELVESIRRWPELKRWERREIGQTLRRLGLSYREIAAVIPVHKGTLSGWCATLELSDEQLRRLAANRPVIADRHRLGVARRMTARKKRAEIRSAAELEAVMLMTDPRWVAGVVAYWAEGGKGKELQFANSDPDMIRLFLGWAITYLDVRLEHITIKLHLHSGQDEAERIQYWSTATGIPFPRFQKTYIKPEGTGHRKNTLYAGTASIRINKSGAKLQRVFGWIDALRSPDTRLG